MFFTYDPNAFSPNRNYRLILRRQRKAAPVIPTIGSIVRKGSKYGKVDSEPNCDLFTDGQPRVYVVPLHDGDMSWADWWRVAELKVVQGV